jgi:hypothetical protein
MQLSAYESDSFPEEVARAWEGIRQGAIHLKIAHSNRLRIDNESVSECQSGLNAYVFKLCRIAPSMQATV